MTKIWNFRRHSTENSKGVRCEGGALSTRGSRHVPRAAGHRHLMTPSGKVAAMARSVALLALCLSAGCNCGLKSVEECSSQTSCDAGVHGAGGGTAGGHGGGS